jgi:hypothetical protein
MKIPTLNFFALSVCVTATVLAGRDTANLRTRNARRAWQVVDAAES